VKRIRSERMALWLILATVATCVLSSVALGEDPWDRNKRPAQSAVPSVIADSAMGSTTNESRSVYLGTSATSPSSGSGWNEIVTRVVYYFARNYAEWFRNSADTRSPNPHKW